MRPTLPAEDMQHLHPGIEPRMSDTRFPLDGGLTIRSVAALAEQARALPSDGMVTVECGGLTQCDAAGLQLLLALRQARGVGMRIDGIPAEQTWRFQFVGLTATP